MNIKCYKLDNQESNICKFKNNNINKLNIQMTVHISINIYIHIN